MASSSESQALTRTYRPSPALNKATRQMVPPFVQKLYELVNASSTDELIRWSDTGDSFFVFEHERFANDVLPRFFKHRNFSSFVRQLNMYGFHKIPHLQQGVLKSDTETEFWNFEHPSFHRGQPDLLCLVTRKNSKGGSQQNPDLGDGDVPIPAQGGTHLLDVNSIVSGITAIKRHQQAISTDLNELKASNQHLWQEALAARERYKNQQDTINRILKFLASVFGRATSHEGTDVDNHGSSTPLVVRRNQLLLIGNGPENNKPKAVEVVEVEDDDNKSITETILTEEQPATPLSFARIDASSVNSQGVPSPTPSFSPLTPSASAGAYIPERGSGTLMAPSWANSSSSSNVQAPVPVTASANNKSALELHRPQPTHGPSPSPTQDQIMQAAFQQLLQSPGQVQRLVQLISSGSPNGSTPVPASLSSPPAVTNQSGSWTPPISMDLPQLSQLALYDGANNALTFDSKDTIGPSALQLDEDQARLARTYQNANEIDVNVDVLQANINALIENMGLDSIALTPATSATSAGAGVGEETPHGPPAHTSSDGLPTSTAPGMVAATGDFDFDAFLIAFANEQDSAGLPVDVDVDAVVDRRSTATPTLLSGSGSGIDAVAKVLQEEERTVAGRKRTSDAAELTLPLLTPSTATTGMARGASPLLGAMTDGVDTSIAATDPPRVKRNKT
ncbi:hypothetical protein B0F90DRAFT_1821421 [Multifurca ochricompacta]|uniref:HSF-type DNA-binding domain-containing protein n=1 Tax=Multifurca ochricompacta TaxID=376703 RepID=A0AAD4LY62_9AGAM|nr:hypothetical protein B0F90DRAFT_1821421 [Multifurca ochricompacta]